MTLPPDVNEGINQGLEELKLSSGADAIKASVETVGDEGVSDGCEQMRALQTEQGQDLTANGGRNQFARSCENTADSQFYSLAVFLGGIDAMIQQVEGVLLRHRVTETELAEVGQ